jgi:hypothetical protein
MTFRVEVTPQAEQDADTISNGCYRSMLVKPDCAGFSG